MFSDAACTSSIVQSKEKPPPVWQMGYGTEEMHSRSKPFRTAGAFQAKNVCDRPRDRQIESESEGHMEREIERNRETEEEKKRE